jgi:CopG antitoxin of type II toxin-antitoxin system
MTQRHNNERVTGRKKSRIPEFKSREEEAKFWDTHSIADYRDELKRVRVRVAKNLSEGLTVQFDPQTLEQLRTRARRKGIGPTQLVRMWVMERLEETSEQKLR